MNEKVVEVDKGALKMALKGLAKVGGQGSGAAKGQRSCEWAAELRVYNLAH